MIQFDIDSVKNRLTEGLKATQTWKDILFYSTNLSLLEPFAEEIKGLADYGNYCLNESKWDNAINTTSLITQLPALGQKEERKRSSIGELRLSTNEGFKEVITLTLTGTIVGDGTADIILRGATSVNVAVLDTDTAIQVATKIASDTFTGWNVTSEDNVVTFTADTSEVRTGSNLYTLVTSTGVVGVFAIPSAHSLDINIPAYSIFKTDSDVSFTNTENYILTTLDTFIDIDVVQGVKKSLSFVAIGDVNEEFEIAIDDIAEKNVQVLVNGVEFIKLDYLELADIKNVDLEESDPTKVNKFYELDNKLDFSGLYLRFGNGFQGDKLESGDDVVFNYIETVGADGNIGSSGVVINVSTTMYDSDNVKADIYSTNLDLLSGGSAIQTIEELREYSAIFQTNDNAVTTDNYRVLIENEFNLKSVVWGSFETNLDNGVDRWTYIDTEENLVKITAINNLFTQITPTEQEAILDFLQPIKSITDIVNFIDAEIINFYYNINAITGKQNLTNTVKSNITNTLIDKYSFENSEFFKSLYLSDYVRDIDSVDLVENHLTTLSFYKNDVFNDSSFGADGNLQLQNITLGSASVYATDLTGSVNSGNEFLLGTYNTSGIFIPETSYVGSTGSLVHSTGDYGLQLVSPLSGNFEDYKLTIYFVIDDLNVILTQRSQILKYDSELTTINVTYS